MIRINGSGITLLGFSEVKSDGSCFATYWFTFVYLPIFPLSRINLIREITKPVFFECRVISKTKLVAEEILKTYLYGWFLFPLLIFGIPIFFFIVGNSNFGLLMGGVWMVVSIWKLLDWGQKRGLLNKDAERNNAT